ncbi:MAG: hypothetical protein M5U15_05545 [Kiritimatiellae bacterium]|nr:hypothetical protein [Kiritimatiellia bacterium]
MKKSILLFTLIFSGALIVEAAPPPPLINYQGVLLDAVGNPVSDTVSVNVAVYADKVGGTAIWQQSIGQVDVSNGLYRFSFGDITLVAAFTSDANWLEITFKRRHPWSPTASAVRSLCKPGGDDG